MRADVRAYDCTQVLYEHGTESAVKFSFRLDVVIYLFCFIVFVHLDLYNYIHL